MRRKQTVGVGAVLLAALAVGGAARADVVPPDVEACNGRAAGAACMVMGGASGACRNDTCSRIDYPSWNRDASATPPTMQYPCVRCVAGATVDAGTSGGGGDDGGGCSVQHRAARAVGPWLLAALPFALLLGRCRKPQPPA